MKRPRDSKINHMSVHRKSKVFSLCDSGSLACSFVRSETTTDAFKKVA